MIWVIVGGGGGGGVIGQPSPSPGIAEHSCWCREQEGVFRCLLHHL